MIRTVTATEAKAKFPALLVAVAGGEEIEITKHGLPVARLVPAHGHGTLKGKLTGTARTAFEEEDLFSTGEQWNASATP